MRTLIAQKGNRARHAMLIFLYTVFVSVVEENHQTYGYQDDRVVKLADGDSWVISVTFGRLT